MLLLCDRDRFLDRSASAFLPIQISNPKFSPIYTHNQYLLFQLLKNRVADFYSTLCIASLLPPCKGMFCVFINFFVFC